VKIGIAVDVNKRVSDLKNDCGLFDLERVEDREDIPHRWYYKIEELVHSELANFNRVLKCGKCRTGKGNVLGSASCRTHCLNERIYDWQASVLPDSWLWSGLCCAWWLRARPVIESQDIGSPGT
jgi:hypothetical protein